MLNTRQVSKDPWLPPGEFKSTSVYFAGVGAQLSLDLQKSSVQKGNSRHILLVFPALGAG